MIFLHQIFLKCDGHVNGEPCKSNELVPVKISGEYIIPHFIPDEDGVVRPWILGSSKVAIIANATDPLIRGKDYCPECAMDMGLNKGSLQ